MAYKKGGKVVRRGSGTLSVVPAAESETGQDELYVMYNGLRIAKRGRPNTPQAGTWVSIEPGCAVLDGPDKSMLVIEFDGVKLQ